MKNKHHLFTSKYAHEFEVTPIIEVIANLDTNDIEKQFKSGMHTWMCIVLDQYINADSLDKLKRYAEGYINLGVIFFENYYMKDVGFFLYQQTVMRKMELYWPDIALYEDILAKAKHYKSYLMQNEKRFMELDEMIRMGSTSKGNKSSVEMSKLMIKKPLIDLQLLNESQNNLFYYLDRSHIYELLYPNDYAIYIYEDFHPYTEFDYEYYKNPPIYSESPKEKKAYLKFLKSWFLESLESRRKLLDWDKVPNAYQNLLAYANDLLPILESIKYPKFIDPMQMMPMPAPVKVQEFPAHIFKSFKAYRLFQTFMEEYKTPSQVSFLFRMMSEKEKPPLIHVKDTPFRDWFNAENYSLKLLTFTKTFDNAYNKDRMDGYNIVKNLIFKQS